MWPLSALVLLTGCRIWFDDRPDAAVVDSVQACTPGTIAMSIADDADDGEVFAAIPDPWFPSGEAVDNGRSFIGWWDQTPIWGYFRFSLPNPLPAGAFLRTATLTLVAGDPGGSQGLPWDPSTYALEVAAEASPNPPPVSSTHFPSGPDPAVLTTTRVRWPATGGNVWPAVGRATTSPNLAEMLRAVVSDPSIQAVQLWVQAVDVPLNVDTEVSFSDVSLSAGPDIPAELTLSYDCL
jgi:hypothetical protein